MTAQLFQIESSLSQHYRLANPVRGNKIAPLCDHSGVQHVFSVGSDNHVYDIYQDPTSDTGWSRVDMGWPGSAKIVALTAGIEADGTTIVFVADADASFYYIRDKRWSNSWQTFFTSAQGADVKAMKLCTDNAGNLLFTAFLQGGTTPSLLWVNYAQTDNSRGDGIGNVQQVNNSYWFVDPLVDYAVGLDASAGNANGLSVYTIGSCSKTSEGTTYVPAGKKTPWENGTDSYWQWDMAFSQVALATNPSSASDSVIFTITSSNSLSYVFDPTAQKLQSLGSVPLSQIRPYLDVQGVLAVVGLGTDNQLYHARQLNADNLDGWSTMVSLNQQTSFLSMSTAKDQDGNIMVFAVDTKFNLWQIWRDATTEEWRFEQVESGKGKIEQINAYVSRISVVDEYGAARANVAVEIKASGPTPVMIDDTHAMLFPDAGTTRLTDKYGRLIIAVDADGLSTPTLLLRTAAMPDGEQVAVEANGDIQAKLKSLSGQDLLQPANYNGEPLKTPLLSGDFNTPAVADALAQACNQAMAMAGAGTSDTSDAARRHLSARTKTRGIRCVRANAPITTGRIELGNTPDAHWELDFGPKGIPVFTPHTRSSAAALMAERRASMKSLSDMDFDVDWGDIWSEVTDVVGEVVSVVVSAVVDTATQVVTEIQAQITLLVDGVKAIYDATIDFVEQVFDMVEGIFQKVLIALEQLYDWLCYIFKWEDIANTAKIIKQLINVSLDVMGSGATQIQTSVTDQFNQLTSVIQNQMDGFIASFAGSEAIGALVNPPAPPQQAADNRASQNPLLDAMLQSGAALQGAPRRGAGMPGAGQPADNSILQEILQALTSFCDTLAHGKGAQAFQDALTYFEAVKDSPDQIFTLAAQGLLKIIEGIGLAALETVGALVSGFFGVMAKAISLVKDMLNEQWTIPIVSDIYEFVTGQPSFSLIEICAMIAAVPTTAFYKVMNDGKAPFSADDVIWADKTITAGWIEQRILGTSLPGAAADGPLPQAFVDGCNYAFAFTALTQMSVDAEINLNPAPPPTGLAWFNIVQRGASSALSLPALINAPFGPMKTFDAVIWYSQLAFGPVRAAFLQAAKSSGMPLPEEIGDKSLSLWGAIRTLMEVGYAIAEAVENSSAVDWRKTTERVLIGVGPQFCRFLHLEKVVAETEGLSLPAGGFIAGTSLFAIATLQTWRTIDPKPIPKPEPAFALARASGARMVAAR